MNIKVCKGCKKLFSPIANEMICIECKKREEEMFVVVKDYLRNNKVATLEELSKETEVPVKLIQKFIKAGRLEVANYSNIESQCKICKCPISTGQLCNKCMKQFENMANSINVPSKQQTNGNKGMYSNFLTGHKK